MYSVCIARLSNVLVVVCHGVLMAHCVLLSAILNRAQASTSTEFQAVQLLESLMGLGKVPFFTQPHMVEEATPPAISRTLGKR